MVHALVAALLLGLALAGPAPAKHFRWASQADANTLDPHANSEALTSNINQMVYDSLVARGKDMSLVPWLAVSWTNPSPRQWIFRLREDVRFHDGSVLTVDDVVFSFERARQSGSTVRVYASQAGTVRALDQHTVEFITPVPTPTLLDIAVAVAIMSKRWCEQHAVQRPQDWKAKEETYAVRNAMGTGPYVLVSREPGLRTVHRKNPGWWGLREGLYEGNVDTVEHLPIGNPASRLAALKSGAVDFVLDPPLQDVARLRDDPELKVWDGPEMRVVYLGFDVARGELRHADAQGRNPFKDARVRRALYQAIDVDALKMHVMRGLSLPTGIAHHDPEGAGLPASLDRRHPFDPAAARRLLAEAGYPSGFRFTFQCTNDRLLNDERLCQAIAAMWARVGITAKIEVMSRLTFFPRAVARDVTAYIMSYGSLSPEAIMMWKPVLRSPGPDGAGTMNYGEVRNQDLDSLIDRIEKEMSPTERRALVVRALELMHEEIPVIPLHRQMIPWASRSNVSVVHLPSNRIVPIWVKVQ